MPRSVTWRRILIGFALGVVVVIAVTIVQNILNTPQISTGKAAPLPAVQQQQPGVTDLQAMEHTFGPFVTLPASNSNTPDTRDPAILLINSDGSEAASTRVFVQFYPGNPWVAQDAPQITALSVSNGYATFQLNTSQVFVYTVKVGQAFILEAEPGKVICIDAHGQQWSISTTSAATLRRTI